MFTIFSCPKPFEGHYDVIQRNALKSWVMLQPRPEIILVGNEESTAEICEEFGVHHMPQIEQNKFATSSVDSVFSGAEKIAICPLMCYINADIILMSDFVATVQKAIKQMPESLMVGQRRDVDVKDMIDFTSGWKIEC